MPRIAYKDHNFRAASLALIEQAQTVLDEYAEQGYTLTLRQLYYQMVARLYLENTTRAYKRLGQLLVDARLAGLVDWNAIVDRTRALEGNTHWESPTEVLDQVFDAYQIDKWANQEYRVEVWIEKDALVGVIEQTCRDLDIDYFSCRGYASISEVWKAARRLRRYTIHGQAPVILHFSDHDPSGIDMTRDLDDRLALFAGYQIEVHRMALLRRQVDHFGLPANPAKLSDSRSGDYVHRHGRSSWELDALEPAVINGLIEEFVLSMRDEDAWEDALAIEEQHRSALADARDVESIACMDPWRG